MRRVRWLCLILCALALTLSGCCNAFSSGDDSAEDGEKKKKSTKKKKKKKKTASAQKSADGEDQTPAPPPDRSSAPPPPPASVDDVLARLAAAAGCSSGDPLYPHWCIAAKGWQSGTVDPLPVRDYLVGYAIPVTAQTEMKTMRLCALTLRRAGGQDYARLLDIRPENDKEKNELAQVVASVGLLFRGKTPSLRIGGGLDSYLRGEAKKASYPVTKGTSSWLIATGGAPAQLRKVDQHWVAVEPKADGHYVSIVSDRIAVD